MSEHDLFRPIREWKEDDRPREKMLAKGKEALSDAELIAILLGTGTRRESALDLAKRLLHKVDNNLVELGRYQLDLLQKINGIGPAKSITISAALELGRRRQESDALERKKIRGSKDIFDVFGPRLGDLQHEEFWVMALNRNLRILGTRKISSGGITGTVADIRLILRYGLESGACSLVLCHNHPSGNTQPSEQDIKLTFTVRSGARLIDLDVVDHLIVTDSAYFSFADEGKLN
jgi:DNA repair protein RadC